MASKLTNVNKNPHVVRYLEKKLANEGTTFVIGLACKKTVV